ncbi:hypothetical protein AAIB33_14675 [Microbacterium sp. AZCO]|uniref:hypothetical protein n=1 Tax=Microbacterium sp. AZCO TaxID=3142976 RepID=UPI0031F46F40
MPFADSATDLAMQLDRALRRVFPAAASGYLVRELRDDDHPWVRASFVLYEYWEIDFVYDRGAFGFSIPFRNVDVPVVRGPNEGQTIADLDEILEELGARVRLRIPDKYLAEWGV